MRTIQAMHALHNHRDKTYTVGHGSESYHEVAGRLALAAVGSSDDMGCVLDGASAEMESTTSLERHLPRDVLDVRILTSDNSSIRHWLV